MVLEIAINDIDDNVLYYENKISVCIATDKDIDTLLSDKDFIMNGFFMNEYFIDSNTNTHEPTTSISDESEKKTFELLKKCYEKPMSVKDFDSYEITFYNETDVLNYKKLLESLDKKITINANYLSTKEIQKLNYLNFKTEPFIIHKYNSINKVRLSEFIETLDTIEKLKNYVVKYDFSKLEQLMFIYDIVRDREYKYESKGQGPHISRDLSSVLKEDKIVCEGYANLFSSVANALGIKTEVKKYYPLGEGHGHATNISYVNDDKYNFVGCIEFDATLDSKKPNIDYLNSYKHFGMPQKYWETVVKSKNMAPIPASNFAEKLNHKYNEYVSSDEDLIKEVRRKFLLDDIIKFYKLFKKDINSVTINKIKNDLLNDSQLEELINIINKIYYQELPLDIFGKAFYRVRRVEHSINPNKYKLDNESIRKVINSKKSIKQQLLDNIFGSKYVYLDPIRGVDVLEKAKGRTFLNKIDYDEKQMRLIHALKHELKNRESNGEGHKK